MNDIIKGLPYKQRFVAVLAMIAVAFVAVYRHNPFDMVYEEVSDKPEETSHNSEDS